MDFQVNILNPTPRYNKLILVVVSRQCMRLIGYVEASELTEAINESRRKPGITSLSKVHFTDYVPLQQAGDPLICRLNHILDIAPMNITDVSSMSLGKHRFIILTCPIK